MSTLGQKKQVQAGSFLPLEKKLKQFHPFQAPKVILIAGPTASGKTVLSLLVAKMLGGEIVSVDSMQVYRGMDIGTAKIPLHERQDIPHHLIDIRQVHESFNVVDFYYAAKHCCDSILARGKVPILVGGTGFYFRAFLYGPPGGPPSLPEVRHSLETEMATQGSEALYQRLVEFDPSYAATITQNDKHKIIRALEIIVLSGEKVSDIDWQGKTLLKDYHTLCWFIYKPRPQLYQAIDQRCEQMLDKGLLEEAKRLDKQGLKQNPSAKQAIGYRQCLDYLASAQSKEDYQVMVHDFKQASKRYAKRQFTWFRKEQLFHWLNVDVHDLEIAAEMIAHEYYAE